MARTLILPQPHPLDAALCRVNRASEHLDELTQRIAALRDEQEKTIIWSLDPEPRGVIAPVRMPLLIPVLVGEICYNLRSALDYLVYELARRDSGGIQKGTQFPIEDKKEQFVVNQTKRLVGLNSTHVEAIARLQPYNGCDWTRVLRDVSNPDKHRSLVGFFGDFTLNFHAATPDRVADFEDMPGPVTITRSPTGEELHVKYHVALELQFPDDERPIIQTLEVLKSRVANTLQAFKTEF